MKELADAAENDAHVMMLSAVVVGCDIKKQFVSQCVKLPPPPAWIMQLSRLADTAERIISPQREADHYAKTTEGTASILMEQCRQSCPYRWATHAIIVSNTHALPAEYKCLK